MKIADLISFESNQLVFKSLKNQAPQYICNLFQRSSDCSLRDLRNTATDLRFQCTLLRMVKKVFPTAEPRYGITLQLVINRHPPFQFLNKLFSWRINFNQDFNLFLSIQQLLILILGFYDFCISISISIFSIIFQFIVSS